MIYSVTCPLEKIDWLECSGIWIVLSRIQGFLFNQFLVQPEPQLLVLYIRVSRCFTPWCAVDRNISKPKYITSRFSWLQSLKCRSVVSLFYFCTLFSRTKCFKSFQTGPNETARFAPWVLDLPLWYCETTTTNINLVSGLEHFLFFHILGTIIPINEYFSEGLKPPTLVDFRVLQAHQNPKPWVCHMCEWSQKIDVSLDGPTI